MNQITQEINKFYQTLGTVCPKYRNVSVTAEELKNENVLSEVLYDLKDNVYAYEGAEELSHKIQRCTNRKRAICNAVSAIGAIVIALGFFMMIGTEGASYISNISLSQIIIQSVISLGVIMLGLIIIIIAKKLEEIL